MESVFYGDRAHVVMPALWFAASSIAIGIASFKMRHVDDWEEAKRAFAFAMCVYEWLLFPLQILHTDATYLLLGWALHAALGTWFGVWLYKTKPEFVVTTEEKEMLHKRPPVVALHEERTVKESLRPHQK